MAKVLIAGGSGLVGTHLTQKLLSKNYEVVILGRTKQKNTYLWDITKQYISPDALKNVDYVINLSGAGIADKRWTKERKQAIINSRVMSGELLFNSFKTTGFKPKAFITASAIGYYGSSSSKHLFNEDSPAAKDFLGQTCKKWESITKKFESIGVRSASIRTGIVLSSKGGALPKIILPIKLGLGAPIGSGKQYMPWIHVEDLCNIYIHAIENETIKGAYNAVAPEHITNEDLTKKIAKAMNKPIWLPKIPTLVMKLFYGEMATLLTQGSKISAHKLRSSGYQFSFYSFDEAFKNLYFSNMKAKEF